MLIDVLSADGIYSVKLFLSPAPNRSEACVQACLTSSLEEGMGSAHTAVHLLVVWPGFLVEQAQGR